MSVNSERRDRVEGGRKSNKQVYELVYLEQQFGVTRDQLLEAIEVAGNDRDDIKAYLTNKGWCSRRK